MDIIVDVSPLKKIGCNFVNNLYLGADRTLPSLPVARQRLGERESADVLPSAALLRARLRRRKRRREALVLLFPLPGQLRQVRSCKSAARDI